MSPYIALLRKEPTTDFGVDFPDFLGCVTAGKTLDEARRMATEALQFHVEGMLEDRDPIPEPSLLDTIMNGPENRDAVAFLRNRDNADEVRPHQRDAAADVVVAIDRVTTNGSRFLAEAAKAKLAAGV